MEDVMQDHINMDSESGIDEKNEIIRVRQAYSDIIGCGDEDLQDYCDFLEFELCHLRKKCDSLEEEFEEKDFIIEEFADELSSTKEAVQRLEQFKEVLIGIIEKMIEK